MRFALGIEYDGTGYFGWQRLREGPTLQGAVESALSKVADRSIEVVCAGRTDAGVHARCQVVHFDCDVQRSDRAWLLGCNSLLPGGMAVLWARRVATEFHARYSARARRYSYAILNRPVRSALTSRYVTWERVPLDIDAMRRATEALQGRHDFSAFRSAACQAKTAVRDVREILIMREDDRVIVEIESNAFLHHMVRNIVGSLLLIGRGRQSPEWMAEILGARDRTRAGPTAPAAGLTFIGPRYPAIFMLPSEVSL
ncbi:MAG: tRNA pseudouridine(38-40) synthase TruA [Rhodanobacteraceae bacterium]